MVIALNFNKPHILEQCLMSIFLYCKDIEA